MAARALDRDGVSVRLDGPIDRAGWRRAVRGLVAAGIAPDRVVWRADGAAGDLFAAAGAPPPADEAAAFTVPRALIDLADQAICHSDPERFALLHRLVLRQQSEPGLLTVATDPLVARIGAMAKAVRRDIHKMHAFVRFRAVETADGPAYVAWFEPTHHIVEAAAPFFARRFAAMRWSILTPERSAHWDGEALVFAAGAERKDAPDDDAVEALWRSYYASIFNPARLKVAMMKSEMPVKYWRNLPEAPLIKPLIEKARERSEAMVAAPATAPREKPQRLREPLPHDAAQARSAEDGTLEALRVDAEACRACPLWENATQVVFGEGPSKARLVFVGEQPGDKEDLAGRPFVGPAGQLFDTALGEAGIDRSITYVTNAVKHFKFEPRGKMRLHAKPNAGEIEACRWWVEREIALIEPDLVVALGATALRSLIGKAVPVGANRGKVLDGAGGRPVFATVHPSYLLRLPDEAAKRLEYDRFVADLRAVRDRLRAA